MRVKGAWFAKLSAAIRWLLLTVTPLAFISIPRIGTMAGRR
jgi:hypothetical protein